MKQREEEIANSDEERARLKESFQEKRFFDVSPKDTDHLKVISSENPDAVPMFKCSGKPEARQQTHRD